jgi:hypothetical protein
MRARAIPVLAGFVVGGLLAAGGVALAPRGGGAAATTTTSVPDAATSKVWWHDPNETIVGTAAVVLERIAVDRDQAVLTYRVVPIGSTRRNPFLTDQGHPPIAPEEWALVTTAGTFRGSSVSVHSERVAFDVGPGFSTASVTGVRIERHRVRVPYDFDLSLPPTRDAAGQIDDDTTVRVVSILAQRTNVLVGVGVQRPTDSFIAGERGYVVRGIGPRWGPPSGRTTSADTPDAWQLLFDGTELPDPLLLRVSGTRWVVRDETISFDIGGLRHG